MRSLALSLGPLLVATAAVAGPPYVTDDPETPEWGGWEINLPLTLERSPDARVEETPLFDVNYGYLPNVQIKVEFPVARVRPAGGPRSGGVGDTSVGVKWRFAERLQGRLQLAVYPQVSVPTGDHERGLGAGKASYVLPVLVQREWTRWMVFGNLGGVMQQASGAADYLYCGAAATREWGERWVIGAELYGNTPTTTNGRGSLAASLGAEWTPRKGRALLLSFGHSLVGEPTTTAYAGVQLQAGPLRAPHHRVRKKRH